jgi:hypothetical protein
MSKIKDLWFCKELMDRDVALYYNGKTGYYNVPNEFFDIGYPPFTSSMYYYDDAKDIFYCDVPEVVIEEDLRGLAIVKYFDSENLSALFSHRHSEDFGYWEDYDDGGHFTNPIFSDENTIYRYDFIDGELIYNTEYIPDGDPWARCGDIQCMIYNSQQLNVSPINEATYQNVNYTWINGLQGYGSGGWQVPKCKIVLNGENYNTVEEDQNYNWYFNDDKTLIVRESKTDGSFRWYFNNVFVPFNPYLSVPSHMTRFIKNGVIVWGCYEEDVRADISDPSTWNQKVGFYDNTVRGWTHGLYYNTSGKVRAIMESTDTGTETRHEWEEPIQNRSIAINGKNPNKIMLNGVNYAGNSKYSRPPVEHNYLYKWDFTKADHDENYIPDEIGRISAITYTDENGAILREGAQTITFEDTYMESMINNTIEIDVSRFEFKGDENKNIGFLAYFSGYRSNYSIPLIYRAEGYNYWTAYGYESTSSTTKKWGKSYGLTDRNAFNNKTVKMVFEKITDEYSKKVKLYLDDVFIDEQTDLYFRPSADDRKLLIGGLSRSNGCDFDINQCYDCDISAIRIYRNEPENYRWYANEDKTLIVRKKMSDNSFRWYFNNFIFTQESTQVPANMQQFILNNVAAYCKVDNGTVNGSVGFYNNTLSLKNYDKTSFITGICKGIIESSYGGNSNNYKWEEPTFNPIYG